MYQKLHRVMVRRPDQAFGDADPDRWHYRRQPNLITALQEHSHFVQILEEAGVEVVYHRGILHDHADAIFVHDPVLVSNQGALVLKMGKELRRGEEQSLAKSLSDSGVPVHYRLSGRAICEGGDLLWLDEDTLAVGLGYRTNPEGLRQLRLALPDVELIPVQLPHHYGAAACLHLMSLISIVDANLAVVYRPLMPVVFLKTLKARGFVLIDVPSDEFERMGTNVLALSPRDCVTLDGNPVTKQRLHDAGCKVATYRGDQISLTAEGGPTCLTRPILRG